MGPDRATQEGECGDFPDHPVAKTLRSQCRGSTFDPWLGNLIPQAETKDPMYCN